MAFIFNGVKILLQLALNYCVLAVNTGLFSHSFNAMGVARVVVNASLWKKRMHGSRNSCRIITKPTTYILRHLMSISTTVFIFFCLFRE